MSRRVKAFFFMLILVTADQLFPDHNSYLLLTDKFDSDINHFSKTITATLPIEPELTLAQSNPDRKNIETQLPIITPMAREDRWSEA